MVGNNDDDNSYVKDIQFKEEDVPENETLQAIACKRAPAAAICNQVEVAPLATTAADIPPVELLQWLLLLLLWCLILQVTDAE
jgi:hypothetical protein